MMKQTNVVWGTYLPYFASLLVIPIIYLSILLLIGQQSLAVVGAALGAVVVYIICKTIQRRGKISLALMIFVFPLLMASGCVLFLQLAPFVNHHQRIGMLRDSGFTINTRPPDQLGEWLQNRSGTMLPVWLIKLMGSDCLSEIDSIQGELGAFQSIEYAQLDMSRAYSVTFIQESKSSHVTTELVEWLNKNSNIESLNFDFRYFSEEDGTALSHIADGRKLNVTIRNCESVAGLGSLSNLQSLHLIGESLPEEVARNISKLALLRSLRLDIRHFPLESIAEFKGYLCYTQIVDRLNPREITRFTRVWLESLELRDLGTGPLVSVDELKTWLKTKYRRQKNIY